MNYAKQSNILNIQSKTNQIMLDHKFSLWTEYHAAFRGLVFQYSSVDEITSKYVKNYSKKLKQRMYAAIATNSLVAIYYEIANYIATLNSFCYIFKKDRSFFDYYKENNPYFDIVFKYFDEVIKVEQFEVYILNQNIFQNILDEIVVNLLKK